MRQFIKENRFFILFLLLISSQQIFFILKFQPIQEKDSITYIEPAEILLETGKFYSQTRTPIYPIFIAAAKKINKDNFETVTVIVQHTLGILLWLLGYKFLNTQKQKIIFSIFWFMDLLFNSYQHVLLPDFFLGFFICLSVAAINYFKLSKKSFIISGMCIALALLTKPVMYIFFLFVLPLFYFTDNNIKERIKKYICFAIFPVLAISINCFNNYRHTSKYSFLIFDGDYSFFTIINFVEIPKNSPIKNYFDLQALHKNMSNEEKLAVSDEIKNKILLSGLPISQINAELKKIFLLSIAKHPIVFAKKTIYETAHFFMNAHNQYAKHYANMPFNLGQAIREKDYIGAIKKLFYSLHIFYWLVFILFLTSILSLIKDIKMNFTCNHYTYTYMYVLTLVLYILTITVLTCQGDARYRVPLQPLLLFLAADISGNLLQSNRENKKI